MSTNPIRLEHWNTTLGGADRYLPPETLTLNLQGTVYGHPRHADGKFISTSPVDRAASMLLPVGQVATVSGSVYVLGEPHPKFVEFCRESGCHVPTPECPILWEKATCGGGSDENERDSDEPEGTTGRLGGDGQAGKEARRPSGPTGAEGSCASTHDHRYP